MEGKVAWLHNGVPDKFMTRRPEQNDALIVLTLGTVTTYKNPGLWVRVAKKVIARMSPQRPVEFWWAGRGPLLATMAELAAREPRIRFLGFRSDPDNLYVQAAVYFQPSEFESFGLAICEAMMFGLPCVVTDCGGPRELVEDGKNGYLIRESDEDLLTERIICLLHDEKLRQKMGEHSRKRYLENFTESKWVNGFSRILREMTA